MATSSEKRIYVSSIPREVSSEELRELFMQFGEVLSAVVVGAKRRKPLSYGFVSFASRQSVDKVIAQPVSIRGQKLSVEVLSMDKTKATLAQFADKANGSVTLYVQDIPKAANKQLLSNYFSSFGDLNQLKLVENQDKSKDCLYLIYKNLDSAFKVKCTRHRITGLGERPGTLVCKIGRFRSPNQLTIFKEAEDLILTHPPVPNHILPTVLARQSATITNLQVNFSTATNSKYSDITSHRYNYRKMDRSVVDIGGLPRDPRNSPDTQDSNYRFNILCKIPKIT